MEFIYVVKVHYDYEGSDPRGYFSTEEKAVELAEKINKNDKTLDGITVEEFYIDEEYDYDEHEKIIKIR